MNLTEDEKLASSTLYGDVKAYVENVYYLVLYLLHQLN